MSSRNRASASPASNGSNNGSNSGSRQAASTAAEYVTTNRFYIEIESQLTASFTECSGLGVTISKEVIQEGGLPDQRRILLGTPEFSDVTLKRGMSGNPIFWNWISALLQPRSSGTKIKEHRRNINILTFNQAGQTQQCWTLIGAVPVGWQSPSLQAGGSEAAIEELTLAYEGLNVSFGSGGGGATILGNRSDTGYFASN